MIGYVVCYDCQRHSGGDCGQHGGGVYTTSAVPRGGTLTPALPPIHPAAPKGWECPRCHNAWAPHVDKCQSCSPTFGGNTWRDEWPTVAINGEVVER